MAGLILQGQVLSVAHMTGANTDDRTGEVRSYDYHRVRVLVDDEVYDVKLDNIGEGFASKYDGPLPEKGHSVAYVVMVTAWKDRTSGRAQISYRALRPAPALAAARAS